MTTPSPPTPDSPPWKLRLAGGVAVVALLVFLLSLVVLAINLDNWDEVTWTRAVFLLQGVEAVAFAAAGWLFGQEVGRQEAKTEDIAAAVRGAQAPPTPTGPTTRSARIAPADEAAIRLETLNDIVNQIAPPRR